ncbi:MAG: hypothetical protein K2V38_08325 [Gemmataceae bacterium]|nr:hypothetical protein [Gemmataceae bacterium]
MLGSVVRVVPLIAAMLHLPSSGQCYYTVAFSPDGRYLAAGGSNCAADVWDLHDPSRPAQRFGPFNAPVIRVQFTAYGHLLLATIGPWFVADSATAPPEFLDGPNGLFARRVAGLAHSSFLAPVGHDVRCWVVLDPVRHAPDPRTIWQLNSVRGATDGAFAVDGRLILARSEDLSTGVLEVRDPSSGRLHTTIPVSGRPHRVACSADGRLAAVLANGHLSVWDVTTCEAVADRYAAATHGGWLSLAFAPDGRRIVTGGNAGRDGVVAVWDAHSPGPPLRTLRWGVGPVYAVAFDRDGLCAAAAGHTGALVWDSDD